MGCGGEKLRLEENVSPIEVVKQLIITNYDQLFVLVIIYHIHGS